MPLSRTDWKYLIDTLLVFSFLGLLTIGLLLAFVIPEGPAAPGRSKYLLGLHRHQWGDIHTILSVAFAALAVVHVVLAWKWVRGKASALFGRRWRAALALTVLAALAVPAVFWLAMPKNDPAYAEAGQGHGRNAAGLEAPSLPPGPDEGIAPRPASPPQAAGRGESGTAGIAISGRMSLGEIEQGTGVPAADIAAGLGLPPGVSLDEPVGRLRRAYGFEMTALRDVVAKLAEARAPAAAEGSPAIRRTPGPLT
jgi:hypothetical protein